MSWEEDLELTPAQASDAYLFPLLGSGVLLGLYCAFKYLDKALVNRILGAYFTVVGTGGLARVGRAGRRGRRAS